MAGLGSLGLGSGARLKVGIGFVSPRNGGFGGAMVSWPGSQGLPARVHEPQEWGIRQGLGLLFWALGPAY